MKHVSKLIIVIASSLTLFHFVSFESAWAQTRGRGGGGGSTPPTSLVVTLGNVNGSVTAMSDVNNRTVELVGMLWDDVVHWKVVGDTTGVTIDVRTLAPRAGSDNFYYRARDINNQGYIVGYQRNQTESRVIPLLWTSAAASQPLVLPLPDLFEENEYDEDDNLIFDDEDVWATSISNDGFILGYARQRYADSGDGDAPNPYPNDYLIVWKFDVINGVLQVQDPFAHQIVGRITNHPEISSTNGHVVWDEDHNFARRMQVTWQPGEENDGQVVVIAGSENPLFETAGSAINVNSSGTAVGNSGGSAHAVELDGALVTIPTLPGFRLQGNRFEYRAAWARDINNSRWVLSSQYPVNVSHGGSLLMSRAADVVSELGGSAIDLKTYAENWEFASARNINREGWITGAVRVNGEYIPALIIR